MASGTISLNAASDQLGGQQSAVDNWVRKYETEGAAAFLPRAGNRGYNRKTAGQTVLTFSEVLTARSAVHPKKNDFRQPNRLPEVQKISILFHCPPDGEQFISARGVSVFFQAFFSVFSSSFFKSSGCFARYELSSFSGFLRYSRILANA